MRDRLGPELSISSLQCYHKSCCKCLMNNHFSLLRQFSIPLMIDLPLQFPTECMWVKKLFSLWPVHRHSFRPLFCSRTSDVSFLHMFIVRTQMISLLTMSETTNTTMVHVTSTVFPRCDYTGHEEYSEPEKPRLMSASW